MEHIIALLLIAGTLSALFFIPDQVKRLKGKSLTLAQYLKAHPQCRPSTASGVRSADRPASRIGVLKGPTTIAGSLSATTATPVCTSLMIGEQAFAPSGAPVFCQGTIGVLSSRKLESS